MRKDELLPLRRWFVIHFIIDMIVAVPLMLAPERILGFLGIDGGVTLARIVSAALLAIGGESFLGRKSNKEGFIGMLRLKIIWSSMAVLALGWGIIDKELSLLVGGSLMGVFLGFNLLWTYWFLKLKR